MMSRWPYSGSILGLRPANERRRYKVTPYLIRWAQTFNQSWYLLTSSNQQKHKQITVWWWNKETSSVTL